MTRITELKIKITSLAAEARLIRREERQWPGDHPTRRSLHQHRVHDVRREARASLLAYGFLRGRRYAQLEGSRRRAPDWTRVRNIVASFGGVDRATAADRLAAWERTDETSAAGPLAAAA